MDLLRVISAFPSGRTTGEILRILGYDLDPPKRRQLLTELYRLTRSGQILLDADRKRRLLTQAHAVAGSDRDPIGDGQSRLDQGRGTEHGVDRTWLA